MIDLSKLTPAPWAVVEECPEGPFDIGQRTVVGPESVTIIELKNDGCASDPSPDYVHLFKADAEFIALARNAFDVMMRRGWTANRQEDGWWVDATFDNADDSDNWHPDNFQRWIREKLWPDPFTALVEADRWFKEHVES